MHAEYARSDEAALCLAQLRPALERCESPLSCKMSKWLVSVGLDGSQWSRPGSPTW